MNPMVGLALCSACAHPPLACLPLGDGHIAWSQTSAPGPSTDPFPPVTYCRHWQPLIPQAELGKAQPHCLPPGEGDWADAAQQKVL